VRDPGGTDSDDGIGLVALFVAAVVVRPISCPRGSSVNPEVAVAASTPLSLRRWIQVVGLSLYCGAAVIFPIYYLFVSFDRLFGALSPSAQNIFSGMVLMGVLGSALRGLSRLFTDVGHGRYQPSWSLSILMRPLEGAGIALVSYLAITAGIILVEQGRPTPNASGYLFVGILSGMFSHRAADALRDRFDALWGRKSTNKGRRPNR
jgi:hypothetical protein